ncbi:MAG: ribonuclease H-like domain-containing protein [Thermoanaerobaculaceae bacterium]
MAKDNLTNHGQMGLFENLQSSEPKSGRAVLVFDLETQKSFEEAGGRNATRQLGMSVGVVYSFQDDQFHVFYEADVDKLVMRLLEADLVVGFNLLAFDYEVLRGYRNFAQEPKTLDIMVDLQRKLSFRPKLDSVVQATLGTSKSADGLQALQWYREGRLDLIAQYCQDDVRLTRDLYLYGKRHGHVLVASFSGKPFQVEVNW